MVTQAVFDKIPDGEIFASGITENSPKGVYMTNGDIGRLLQWVAKKGYGHDWAIYIYWCAVPTINVDWLVYLAETGEKVMGKDHIKKLVVAEDSVYSRYRP